MGVPSIFLRTFGCNFTCSGFNMPKGESSTAHDVIAKDIDKYSTYEELPIVATGCDSYASWDPRFKHLSPMMETDGIANRICELLPGDGWEDEHLVITGGEPLLGWQRAYPDLLDNESMQLLKEITFETNGSQKLHADFKRYLKSWTAQRDDREITFSVSAKLSCSGEDPAEAIRPDIVCEYEEVGYTYLKFVIATEEDAEEALEATDIYRAEGFTGPVYLMPVGGTDDVYELNNRRVAELAMENGLRYSDRLQVPLFKNEWGT